MEYIGLVEKIIAAEQSAREMVRQAEEKAVTLETDLEQEITRMREDYMARAKRRLAAIEKTEQEDADADIKALDVEFHRSMATVEQAYKSHKNQWVDTLFSKIAGDMS